jgi:hypothetical protein
MTTTEDFQLPQNNESILEKWISKATKERTPSPPQWVDIKSGDRPFSPHSSEKELDRTWQAQYGTSCDRRPVLDIPRGPCLKEAEDLPKSWPQMRKKRTSTAIADEKSGSGHRDNKTSAPQRAPLYIKVNLICNFQVL